MPYQTTNISILIPTNSACCIGNATFTLHKGVKLYGGFASDSTGTIADLQSALNARSINNVTTLSGDLNGDDVPATGSGTSLSINSASRADNVYHVVTGGTGATAETTLMDGFTITGGYANVDGETAKGGGMYNNNSSPTLNNLTFIHNYGKGWGAGMYNSNGSSPVINNSTFAYNMGASGVGMFNFNNNTKPIVTNSTFYNNVGIGISNGGAIHEYENSQLTCNHCTIVNNALIDASQGNGSAILGNDYTKITNSIIWGNTSTRAGAVQILVASNNNLSNNVIQDWTSGGTGNTKANPDLDTLANNGGLTQTVAIGKDGESSALGKGVVDPLVKTDQRGVARSSTPSIGAFEAYDFGLSVDNFTYGDFGGSGTKNAITITDPSDVDLTKTGVNVRGINFAVTSDSSGYKLNVAQKVNAGTATPLMEITYTTNGQISTTTRKNMNVTVDKANLTSIAASRDYNGTTKLAGSNFTLVKGVDNETLTLSGAGDAANLASKNATNGTSVKLASVSGLTLDNGSNGGLANNYKWSDATLASIGTNQITINKKTLNAISDGTLTANNKTYDGNTTATVSEKEIATGIGSEKLKLTANGSTFADKNVGTGKTVILGALTLGNGTDGLASNYQLASSGNQATTTAEISKADITAVTGITASNKTYDGSTSAMLTTSGAGFTGMISGDHLSVATATGAFADKNVGTGKTVNITSITLGGTDAGNYNLSNTNATAQASISKAAVTLGIADFTKTYDGTTTVGNPTRKATSGTVFTADSINSDGTIAFENKNAGTTKVNVSGITINDGNNGGNYDISYADNTASSITAKAISAVTGITANGKTYDGNISAVLNTSGADYTGMISGDNLSVASATGAFADKNVGTGKAVNITGISLGGTDAGNYNLTNNTATTQANIDKANLTVTANNQTHYQGKTFVFNGTEFTATGLVANESIARAELNSAGANSNALPGRYTIAVGSITGGVGFDPANYNLQTLNGEMLVTSATPAVPATPTGYAEALLTLQYERRQMQAQEHALRQRLELEQEMDQDQYQQHEDSQQRKDSKLLKLRHRPILTIIDGGIKLPA